MRAARPTLRSTFATQPDRSEDSSLSDPAMTRTLNQLFESQLLCRIELAGLRAISVCVTCCACSLSLCGDPLLTDDSSTN